MSFNAGELEVIPLSSKGSLASSLEKNGDWYGWGE